jgi:ketosteroid isomerase-like protein
MKQQLPRVLLFACLGWAAVARGELSGADSAGLTTKDASMVRAASQAYRDAWVANNQDAVMATLTDDAVLLPSGMPPIVGSAAIRAFWWPPGATATKILAMDLTFEEVAGEGAVGYVRGQGSVTFSHVHEGNETIVRQRHTYLNILRRQSKGGWRISHRMWSDLK